MAALRWNNLGGILLTLNVFLILKTNGQNWSESCPVGWIAFEKTSPQTCLWISDSGAKSLEDASNECGKKNASLIVIQSQVKLDVFKDIVNNKSKGSPYVWLGLMKFYKGLRWLTKDGLIPATSLPHALQIVEWNEPYQYGNYYNKLGLQYRSNSFQILDGSKPPSARYICEQRKACKFGWFGMDCEHGCHCNGQDCDPMAVDVECQYGCKVGWMGKRCTQRKEAADVSYFCVNAEGQGKYAHILIDTKEVYYESISPVDKNGIRSHWCDNSTSIKNDSAFSLVTIKIYVDNRTRDEVNDGRCAGTIDEDGNYQWTIKLEEKEGLVSRIDQEVHIQCNFADADDFSISKKTSIKREKWFRRNDVRKKPEYLNETKESLDIQVVDPSTGDVVSQAEIGTSVALRIRFNLVEDDLATGVSPFNCYASASDDEHKIMILNEYGCPVVRSPVTSFFKNGSKSLITQPFPLFGLDMSTDIDFQCSYKLCFGSEVCTVGCRENETSIHNVTRHRRSAIENKLMVSVELLSANERTRTIPY